jgi:hypothetical protein
MTTPDDTTAKVTSLAEVRAMRPRALAEAKRAGRLDMAALAAEARDRPALVRQLVRQGATPSQAAADADAILAARRRDRGDDLPPAA